MTVNQRIVVLVLITLVMALGNLLGPTLFEDAREGELSGYLGFLASGCLLGQCCLLAAWAAWGAQAASIRLPISFGLLVAGACTFNLGLRIVDSRFPLDAAIAVFIAALLLFISMQVPLWIIRSRMRCRIDLRDVALPTREEESMQFGMRHLLLWTTVISLIVVLVKYSLPADSSVSAAPWGEIVFAMLVMAIFTTFVAVPCLGLSLKDRAAGLWPLWLGTVGLLGPIVVLVLLSLVLGTPSDFSETLASLYCLTAGTVFCLLATGGVLRALGYRLRGVADRSPLAAAVDGPPLPEAAAPESTGAVEPASASRLSRGEPAEPRGDEGR